MNAVFITCTLMGASFFIGLITGSYCEREAERTRCERLRNVELWRGTSDAKMRWYLAKRERNGKWKN